MTDLKLPAIHAVACAVVLLGSMLDAQALTAHEAAMQVRLEALTQELADQRQLLTDLDLFRQQYVEQKSLLESLERQVAQQEVALEEMRGVARWDRLATMRGAGKTEAPLLLAQAQTGASPQAQALPPKRSADTEGRPPEVAPLFEQPGVLTPKGRYVLEPSVQYGYSSSNRVSLVGYTIIPALLIGLIDVREVKRNTFTASLTGRLGVTNRLEIEARVPYVHRSDSTVNREVGVGTATDGTFSASGSAIGDVELGARYQLNQGGVDSPFYVGSVRFKTRTGTDPFSVVTRCTTRCVDDPNASGLPLELPTGSGFNSLQAGLTVLYPSDPAVFFGSVTYMHNFSRDHVRRQILNGQEEDLGKISPGGVLGFNFGLGLALNEKASLSLGYDHSSVGITKRDGQDLPGSVRTQLGTLLLGFSYRFNPKTTLNVSVGAGLTRDTPDVSLTVRLPMMF
jgi:hypothetical protein